MEHLAYASKGAGQIHAVVWMPAEPPKGILQIVHGVAEYAERYSAMAQFFTERGFMVAAEDHMGHGKSICEACPQGNFVGGWDAVVADSYSLTQLLIARYPELPFFLLGHSMGSFIARSMLICYPEMPIKGAILSGTAWQPKAALIAGRALCRVDARMHGAANISSLINNLAFGGYSKSVKPARTAYDWLSTDSTEVDKYVQDPLCGFPVADSLAEGMMSGLSFIQTPEALDRMNKELPVWFLAGKADPVGDMSKGVRKAYEAFLAQGMKRVSITFYDGRHEIHNEPVRQTYFEDLLSFMTE